jgi:hypothetical protein
MIAPKVVTKKEKGERRKEKERGKKKEERKKRGLELIPGIRSIVIL